MSYATRPGTLFEQVRDCGIFYARTGAWLIPWGFLFYATNFGIALLESASPLTPYYGLYGTLFAVIIMLLSFIVYVFFHGIFIHQTWLIIQKQPHPLRNSLWMARDRFFHLAAGFVLLLILFFVLPSCAFYFLLSDLLVINPILAWTLLAAIGLYVAIITTFLVAYIPLILFNHLGCLEALRESVRQVKGNGWRVFGIMSVVFWIPFTVMSLLHLQTGVIDSLWMNLIAKGLLFSLFTSLNFVMLVVVWQNLAAYEAVRASKASKIS